MSDHVWFIDRCLGKNVVADALRKAGARVEVHDDHFAQDALDEDWLVDVGNRGWLVVTRDERIMRRPAERAALKAAKVGAFVVAATGIAGPAIGALLAQALPAMARRADQLLRPFIVTLSASGLLTVKDGERRGGKRKP